MLIKVFKSVDASDKPDTIELESAFKIGDTFKMEYDWCKRKPAMNGYIMEWHKDTAVFKVEDIVCNKVINPHEVWIRLTSDDELFNHRCGIGVFDAPEKQILERKVA